jgi:hypothetical protein
MGVSSISDFKHTIQIFVQGVLIDQVLQFPYLVQKTSTLSWREWYACVVGHVVGLYYAPLPSSWWFSVPCC